MDYFYQRVPDANDIKQGDIFSSLPFLAINSPKITEVIAEGQEPVYKEIDLNDYVGDTKESKTLVIKSEIRPGIVITQNCDMLRSEYISYCAIRPFDEIEKNFSPNNQKKQVEFLTKTYINRAKYFYLPPETPNGFDDRMAVDFSFIHQIKLDVIKQLISKRRSALNTDSLEHFRIKLSDYFKRYAYNPWYVLNKGEFDTYVNVLPPEEIPHVRPYPWQI